MSYQQFLNKKIIKHEHIGIDVNVNELNNYLYDFQKAIVQWALKKGKACIFADTGMGKTAMQIEWINKICNKGIILTPLSVSYQTIKEAEKMDIKISSLRKGETGKIDICNYEYLEHINFDLYDAVVLDESSILKSFMGKTKQLLFKKFKNYKYKLCCTATPSPNDQMELLNHCEFIDVMKSNEALAIWYINDTMNFGNYRIKKYAERDFWNWVSSWAVFFENPAQLGFNGDMFILPKLKENYIEVDCDIVNNSDNLFGYREVNAVNYNQIKREVIDFKIEEIKKIIQNNPKEQFLIWCYNNVEADKLRKNIENVTEIRGNDPNEKKEKAAIDFIESKIKILISKPSIFGFGMNFQNCHNVIYCGLSFSFEEYYQSVRRLWRYGQKKEVNVYILMSIYEKNIYEIVNQKKEMHSNMKKSFMFNNSDFYKKEYKMDYETNIFKDEKFTLINGDCIEEIKKLSDESIDFSIFSPPFSQLYIYSDSYRDMGNCKDDKMFFEHFDFLVQELFRILKSGRLVAVHCKNLVNYKGRDGRSGLRDFRGDIIRLFEKCNFQYHSEVCIWKDPVIEMQRTKSHGLLYKQLRKDSSYSRQGLPDYLVMFRKWTDRGDVAPVNQKTHENFKLDKWQQYASPVWFDIQQTNVLNKNLVTDDDSEKHICPLQLDVIERALDLWTNQGDTVFTPFAGIGSEVYQSIIMNRKALGIELKKEYFETSIKFCIEAKNKILENEKSLFN